MHRAPPSTLKNRYQLKEAIGVGQKALVYRAFDTDLQRDVMVKFLAAERLMHDDVVMRFSQATQAVARLSHPNILHLYDMGSEANWHYQIGEYLHGIDLQTHLVEAVGLLPLTDAIFIIQEILQGLVYAHKHMVMHGAITPQHILLTDDDQVKISGFGSAVLQASLRLSQEERIERTLFYQASEVALGQAWDGRADLYAVGAIFYEILGGHPPFMGVDVFDTLSKILNAPLYFPEVIPMAFQPFLSKLLAKQANERFETADIALVALHQLQPPPANSARRDTQALGHVSLLDMETTSVALEAERRRFVELLQTQLAKPLNLIVMQASTYEQTLSQNPQAKMVAGVLASLARQTIQHLQDLENSLSPRLLETLGFEAALATYIHQLTRNYGTAIQIVVSHMREPLPYPIALIMFRAVQEVLHHAIHQVKASQIVVEVDYQDDKLSILLSDNGMASLAGDPLGTQRHRLEEIGAHSQHTQNKQGGLDVEIKLKLVANNPLTPREEDVLQALARGLTNKEIALQLSISTRTVNFHLDNIYSKLGVGTRTEAVMCALRQGWIDSHLFK